MRCRPSLMLVVTAAATLAACTSTPTDEAVPSPSASPTSQPSPQQVQLTARQRAQQLNALSPESFDARYRLSSKGSQPNASVRMRARGERFRLDITHGRRTAVLLYVPGKLVSCQVVAPRDKRDHRRRSCFLVAHTPGGVPHLFDPELQRLFRSTTQALSRSRSLVTVSRAPTWQAPHTLGPAECFDIEGKDVEPGRYCYLSRPGPTIGMLARARFPSGTLEIRDVRAVGRARPIHPPVHPTPLPGN